MRFLSDGDYIFPFDAYLYWTKQAYLWSYQNGAINPDGIIRMPARLIDVLVFALFGNVAIGYFYLFSILAIAFAAFYYFARRFLEIKSPVICAVSSLFFTFNPIFLGNIAKVGLILAVAMLPLCLVMVKRIFEEQRFKYLILWVIFLNISLLHPFTFTVNLLVSGSYFVYQAWYSRKFMARSLGKFSVTIGVALLLNAYFILPLAAIGTVSKDALSSDATSTPVDYTSLIAISNTGDIFTGLSLSKNVLKDFEFYNSSYQNFYFLGVFALYAILLAAYVRVEKRLTVENKKRFIICLLAFLVLIMLAAVKFMHIDVLIKFLVTLPGGWMFRSPLKWQLYIPLVLFAMLAIILTQVKQARMRAVVYAGLGLSFLLMNAFIGADIYKSLLTPRSIKHFGSLHQMDLNHKNILIVGSDRCFSYAASHPEVMTELNQVLISKNAQVKQVSQSSTDSINLGSYNYIIGCQNTMENTLAQAYNFKRQSSYTGDAFQLYVNRSREPYIRTATDIFVVDNDKGLGNEHDFAVETLQKEFSFVPAHDTRISGSMDGLQDVFKGMSFGNLDKDTIETSITPIRSGGQDLYIKNNRPLYYDKKDNQVLISTVPQEGYKPLQVGGEMHRLPASTQPGQRLNVAYTDPSYNFKNLIPNPGLEQGAWQPKVGDCYAYDSQPSISMGINKKDKTDGQQSLRLEAGNHIACTGPDNIAVKAGQHYLLGFDYKNVGGQYAGYYISFDDPQETYYSDHLKATPGNWQTFTKDIVVPEGARTMRLLLYAYPDGSGVSTGTALYDHFQLSAVPDVRDRFYLVSPAHKELQKPSDIQYKVNNPTKNTISVRGASAPFYLATSESYNPNWRLGLKDRQAPWWSSPRALPDSDHIKLGGTMNGWYIDPAKLCSQDASGCTRHADGSYDMSLVMEFAPQRLFYTGTLISGLTFAAVIAYFIYDFGHRRPEKKYRWRK